MSLSTHVLDATTGTPAAGLTVQLSHQDGPQWTVLATADTDPDGRIRDLLSPAAPAGNYRLTFGTAAWYAARAVATFYPEVTVAFTITDPAAHHHVPLLLSPYAYSTYRGS